MSSRLRTTILMGSLVLAAFGGSVSPAAADKMCMRVEVSTGSDELTRFTGFEISHPVCIKTP